jgi:hypothetical protein
MRLHDRLHSLAVLAALALVATAVSSCQTLSGSGKGGPEFIQVRKQLTDARTSLDQAASDGSLDRVGPLLKSISSNFDVMENRSSAINMVDREHLAIQIATGRRTITETDRWVASADVDAVRSQVKELDGILADIDQILDRAIRGSTDAGSGS